MYQVILDVIGNRAKQAMAISKCSIFLILLEISLKNRFEIPKINFSLKYVQNQQRYLNFCVIGGVSDPYIEK